MNARGRDCDSCTSGSDFHVSHFSVQVRHENDQILEEEVKMDITNLNYEQGGQVYCGFSAELGEASCNRRSVQRDEASSQYCTSILTTAVLELFGK